MGLLYRNISGELTKRLIKEGSNLSIKKISFTNVHASTTCTLDLFVEKKLTGRIYLLKSIALPVGATLLYSDIVTINTTKNEYSLFVKLTKGASETPTVDIIMS